MEFVTVAQITLNRVGSASGYYSQSTKRVTRLMEVPESTPQVLRERVVDIAVELGERRESLSGMAQESHWNYRGDPNDIIFNIHGPNTIYGEVYAVCRAYPALKVGERYFKLEEIRA